MSFSPSHTGHSRATSVSRAQSHGTIRSRTGSQASRKSTALSVYVQDALTDPRIEKPGACKWDKQTVADQNDIVAEIGRAVLSGKWPSNHTWYKFNSMTKRATVTATIAPGPGHYEHKSGFGKQHQSDRATKPTAKLPPKKGVKSIFHLPSSSADGSHRIKVLNSELQGDEGSDEVIAGEVEDSLTGQALYNSKYPTAPAHTFGYRWRDTGHGNGEGSDNPPVQSSLGRQATSGHVTAPTTSFTRLQRLNTPDRTFGPNPLSYNPNLDALRPKPPVVRFGPTSTVSADDNAYMDLLNSAEASAGKYDVRLGIGVTAPVVVAGRNTAPGYSFGADIGRLPTLEQDKLMLAHDKQQPQGLRQPSLPPRNRFNEPLSYLPTLSAGRGSKK